MLKEKKRLLATGLYVLSASYGISCVVSRSRKLISFADQQVLD